MRYYLSVLGCGITVGATWVAALLRYMPPRVAYGVVYGVVAVMWIVQGVWLVKESKRLSKRSTLLQIGLEEFNRGLEEMRDAWRQVHPNTDPPL